MINAGLFSSACQEWQTPAWLFAQLDSEFHFGLDAAATAENGLCPRYYTRGQDAFKQDWTADARSIWLNPPYGREVGRWVQKAHEEGQRGATVVVLLAARTDTRWFHTYCTEAREIRFIKGRLRFEGNGVSNTAPFPSMVVVFGPEDGPPKISALEMRRYTDGRDEADAQDKIIDNSRLPSLRRSPRLL